MADARKPLKGKAKKEEAEDKGAASKGPLKAASPNPAPAKPAEQGPKSPIALKTKAQKERESKAPEKATSKPAAPAQPVASPAAPASKAAPVKATAPVPKATPPKESAPLPVKKSTTASPKEAPQAKKEAPSKEAAQEQPKRKAPSAKKSDAAEDKSAYGRVARSIRERSMLPLIVGLLSLAFLVISVVVYRMGSHGRMIAELKKFELVEYAFSLDLKYQKDLDENSISEDLRFVFGKYSYQLSRDLHVQTVTKDQQWLVYDNEPGREQLFAVTKDPRPKNPKEPQLLRLHYRKFEYPGQVERFHAKSDPKLAVLIDEGAAVIPKLLAAYPKMSKEEKIAAIIILGEIPSSAAVDFLVEEIKSKDSLIASFACRSAGNLKENSTSSLIQRLMQFPSERRAQVLDAIAKAKSDTALNGILGILKFDDPEMRKMAILRLASFDKKQSVVKAIVETLDDKDEKVALAAVSAMRELQRNRMLSQPQIEYIHEEVKARFDRAKAPEARARYLRAIAVAGLMENKEGSNHVSLYLPYMQRFVHSDNVGEKAAAIYGLGLFQNNEFLDILIQQIDTDSVILTQEIAAALNNMNDQDIVPKLLKIDFASSKRQHTILAVAKILENYYNYAVRLNLVEKAADLLKKMSANATDNSQKAVQKALRLYAN